VFKVFRKDFLGELIIIENDEADAIWSPSNNILVLFILTKGKKYIQKFIGLLEEG
jgi:hypothetical protein